MTRETRGAVEYTQVVCVCMSVFATYDVLWETSVRADRSDDSSRRRLLAATRVDEFDGREYH
jgi:hypothetical protein